MLRKLVVTIAAFIASVSGHGYLAEPAARNVLSNYEWCSHCLNGPGVCGDRAGVHDNEVPGKVSGTYDAGGTMRARVVITANHVGRWGLEICGTERAHKRRALLAWKRWKCKGKRRRSRKCRRFDRQDRQDHQDGDRWSDRTENIILNDVDDDDRTENDDGGDNDRGNRRDDGEERGGGCTALRTTSGDRWVYLRSEDSSSSANFRIPSGTPAGNHVVRWTYETGNSCTPPGTPREFANSNLGECHAGDPVWEKFRNCADVRIVT